MPSRLSRVALGVLVVAVPFAGLLYSTQGVAAAERAGVAAVVGASYGQPIAQGPLIMVLPSGTVWRAAAAREKRAGAASRSSSPHAFGTIAYNKWYAREFMAQKYGWRADQFAALDVLWQRESGWNHTSHNASSGAHGIPQALPGSKMGMFGADWATNPETQIQWGLQYINSGYGSPAGALAFWNSHSWY